MRRLAAPSPSLSFIPAVSQYYSAPLECRFEARAWQSRPRLTTRRKCTVVLPYAARRQLSYRAPTEPLQLSSITQQYRMRLRSIITCRDGMSITNVVQQLQGAVCTPENPPAFGYPTRCLPVCYLMSPLVMGLSPLGTSQPFGFQAVILQGVSIFR